MVDPWTTVGSILPEVIRQIRFVNQPKELGLFEMTIPSSKNDLAIKVLSALLLGKQNTYQSS